MPAHRDAPGPCSARQVPGGEPGDRTPGACRKLRRRAPARCHRAGSPGAPPAIADPRARRRCRSARPPALPPRLRHRAAGRFLRSSQGRPRPCLETAQCPARGCTVRRRSIAWYRPPARSRPHAAARTRRTPDAPAARAAPEPRVGLAARGVPSAPRPLAEIGQAVTAGRQAWPRSPRPAPAAWPAPGLWPAGHDDGAFSSAHSHEAPALCEWQHQPRRRHRGPHPATRSRHGRRFSPPAYFWSRPRSASIPARCCRHVLMPLTRRR